MARCTLAAVRWFSPGTPVSSTNKIERPDLSEILLKVTLSTITLKLTPDYVGFDIRNW
jgi:hypothetical protein